MVTAVDVWAECRRQPIVEISDADTGRTLNKKTVGFQQIALNAEACPMAGRSTAMLTLLVMWNKSSIAAIAGPLIWLGCRLFHYAISASLRWLLLPTP